MHWLGWLIYGTVVLWLVPATLWRPVALAILTGWWFAEVNYQAGGSFIPLALYIPTDLAVIGIVWLFGSHWTDYAIAMLYPVAWVHYPDGNAGWQWLYCIALLQMILAGPWPALQKASAWASHGPLRTGKRAHEVR